MRRKMTKTQRNDLTIYNTVADQWWSDDIRWVRTLKNLVPGRLAWFDKQIDWANKAVLDLGCAGGFMAEALASRGAKVTGIDPAAEAIKAAQDHAAQAGYAIRYDVGVGEALPYADHSFDAIVCVDVLEHVSDLTKVAAEIARVLRPGGLFLYDTINRNPLAQLGDDYRGRGCPAPAAEGHARSCTLYQAERTEKETNRRGPGAWAPDGPWTARYQSKGRLCLWASTAQDGDLHGCRASA